MALRFPFTITLKRRDLSRSLVITRIVPRMPEVLSVEEAARLLQAAPGIKYKAALGVAYGAGLRVSEVAHLKVDDFDSKRMLIRVEQGKGGKDRNAMLSPQLLELLRMTYPNICRSAAVARPSARLSYPAAPIQSTNSHRATCWNRGFLHGTLRTQAPETLYLPSRSAPNF